MQLQQAAQEFQELGHGFILQALVVKTWMGGHILLKSWKSPSPGLEQKCGIGIKHFKLYPSVLTA